MVINWSKTLRNVLWHHKEKSIEFSIKDIEDLSAYINGLGAEIKRQKYLLMEERKKSNELLSQLSATHAKVLSTKIEVPDILEDYKIDALA